MKRRLKIKTIVAIAVALSTASVGGVGFYAGLRVLPAAHALRGTTEPLLELYARLAEGQQWLGDAVQEANAAVRTGTPETRERLRRRLEGRDQLVGALPLAAVPIRLRVPLARAEDEMARLVVLLDEMATLLELGRQGDAAARLADVHAIRARVVGTIASAEIQGLDDVVSGQRELERLARQFVLVCVLWLLATTAIVGTALRTVRRRFAEHLGQLLDGLERVGRGDLNVALAPVADDELQALSEHFNSMTRVLRDRAERQGQVAAAGELLASAAHEVNNPLMAIVATAQERLNDPMLPARVRVDFEGILGEAHRAAQLLHAIVRFLRPGPRTARAVAVNDVVRDTWDLIWPRLRADGIQTNLDLAPDLSPVVADPHRLEQLLVNLLSNAHQAVLKVGAPRRLAVRTCAREGRVVIAIHDNGPGVPEDVRAHLFKPFYSTQPDGRAGLGLYTARLLARDAGGDVVQVAGEERGAVFEVTLPAAPAATAAATGPEPAVRAGDLKGAKLLVVDDEPSVRRPIAKYLARHGAEVREAGNGEEALASLAGGDAHVILADLRMPVMDGITFYRELAARDPALAARVLFFSGDVAQLGQLGQEAIAPDRVLTKPIDLAELERRVVEHLR